MGKLSRFALVGAVAMLVHLQVSLTTLTLFDTPLHRANLYGFGTALGVSYLGHYYVSFHSMRGHWSAILRFLGTAFAAYLGNVLVVAALSATAALPREICLLFGVSVMPLVSFTLSRFWVYT